MTKIVISALYPDYLKPFTHNLTPQQAETILGGIYASGIGILNVTDSTYLYNSPRADRRFYAVGLHSFSGNENSYDSFNYSRTIYNG